jgi:hypothetical protein
MRPGLRLRLTFRKNAFFYVEGLLAPRRATKLEGHPLLSVRSIYAQLEAVPTSAPRGRAMPWCQGTHAVVRLLTRLGTTP